jgi:hypothetical protein
MFNGQGVTYNLNGPTAFIYPEGAPEYAAALSRFGISAGSHLYAYKMPFIGDLFNILIIDTTIGRGYYTLIRLNRDPELSPYGTIISFDATGLLHYDLGGINNRKPISIGSYSNDVLAIAPSNGVYELNFTGL